MKVRYYGGNPDITSFRQSRLRRQEISFQAFVISIRGGWCSKNDEFLKILNLKAKLGDMAVIKVLQHGTKIYRHVAQRIKRQETKIAIS